MKADAHRRHAESLERAIALARPDPITSVAIIENAWGATYHWLATDVLASISNTETSIRD